MGQIGGQIYRDIPAVLLLYYMTNTLGVPGVMAGIAILIPKTWVVFCDPLVGVLSDRSGTRWGRRHPFMFIGAILCPLSLVMLFGTPSFGSPVIAAIYVSCIFLLGSTAFSSYSVPYLSMASEMTNKYHERTRIMAYRFFFTAVGLTIGAGLSQPLVSWLGGGASGYFGMAVVVAGICFVSMMGCVLTTRKIQLHETGSSSLSILKQVSVAARNRPFLIIAIATLLFQIGAATGFAVLAFLFHYVVENDTILLPFIGILSVGILLSVPFWNAISRRMGKMPTLVVSVIGWLVITATWPWASYGDTDPLFRIVLLGAISERDMLVLLRGLLIGLTQPGFQLMGLSMLADTIEYDRLKSGHSRAGLYSGLWNALEKLAFALGPFLSGVLLSVLGFVESTVGPLEQTEQAISGIFVALFWVPFLTALLGLCLLPGYNLSSRILSMTERSSGAPRRM